MNLSFLNNFIGGDKRSALIRKNILASFFIKGWVALVQFLMVPLTLHCLGAYENGIWLTISSMLLWVDNLDIGLGNGLRNRLAECLALNDMKGAKSVVSSTFFMLIVLFIPIIILVNVWIYCTDVYSFLNVSSSVVKNLSVLLHVAAILVCSTFVFKFIGNFYMALQLPAINNMLNAIGQTLALVGTLVVYYCGSHSLLYIALVNTLSPLLVYLASYPITFYIKYPHLRPSWRCVRVRSMCSLANMGIKFFVLQVAGIVLFMTTNILISRYLSPEMVTPYQIAYRYFWVIQLVLVIVCMPYWSATTDAYKRGDYAWINKANTSLNRIVMVLTAMAIIMIMASRYVYYIWIGNAQAVPFDMTCLVALYIMVLVVSMRYSYILNGFGALKIQLIATITAAVLFIPLALVVCKATHSLNGLLVVMSAVNLPGLVLNLVQYRKIVSGKAKGIWLE